jgi:hypothetical protein
MPRSHKIGIFVLFGSGFICIAFATLRVIQLGIDGRGKTTTPEPKWMLLWTVLECSMGKQSLHESLSDLSLIQLPAIIIGCSPAFAVLIRKRLNDSKKRSYGANGYPKKHLTNEDVKLKAIVSPKARPKRDNMDAYWDDNNSSQEELAKNAGQSATRATMHQDDDSRTGSISKM